jgi:phytoene/squalene synthetase
MEKIDAACEDRRQLEFREKEHLHQYCVSVARAVALLAVTLPNSQFQS